MFATMRTAAVRTAALLNMQKEDALRAIRQEIAHGVEQFRKRDLFELPMPAILASAVKL